MDIHYNILYTHQKTKKAKVWQDGFLVVIDSCKKIIYDEKGAKIDTLFAMNSIAIGDEYETDKYLVMVDSVRDATGAPSSHPVISNNPLPRQPAHITKSTVSRSYKGFNPPKRVVSETSASQNAPLTHKRHLQVQAPQQPSHPSLFSTFSQRALQPYAKSTVVEPPVRRSECDILSLISSTEVDAESSHSPVSEMVEHKEKTESVEEDNEELYTSDNCALSKSGSGSLWKKFLSQDNSDNDRDHIDAADHRTASDINLDLVSVAPPDRICQGNSESTEHEQTTSSPFLVTADSTQHVPGVTMNATDSPQVANFSLGSLSAFTDDDSSQVDMAKQNSPIAVKGDTFVRLDEKLKRLIPHSTPPKYATTSAQSTNQSFSHHLSADGSSKESVCSLINSSTAVSDSHSLSFCSSNSPELLSTPKSAVNMPSCNTSAQNLISVPQKKTTLFDFLRDNKTDLLSDSTSLFELDDSFSASPPVKQSKLSNLDSESKSNKWSLFNSPSKSETSVPMKSSSILHENSPEIGLGLDRSHTRLAPPKPIHNNIATFGNKLPAEKIVQAKQKVLGNIGARDAGYESVMSSQKPFKDVSLASTGHNSKQMVDSLILRFPAYSADVDKPLRNLSMPISFKTSVDYKHALEQILREHINIILLEMSRRYHECLATVNISNIFPGHYLSSKTPTGIDSLSSNTKLSPTLGNPRCQHGAFSKLVEVKKEGSNKGRMFYTCANARGTQCNFFEWAKAGESTSTSSSASGSTQQEICSLQALETYLKSKSILFYSSCQLNRTTEHYSKKWVVRNDTALSQSLYLKLNRKEKASTYTKGDLWVISQTMSFDLTGNTFIAKSIFYGPNSNNDVEISPIAGYYSCNWVGGAKCYALHAANVSTELECLTNLADLNARTVPLLPWLIHSSGPERTNSRFEVPSIKTAQSKMLLPEDVIDELAARVIQKYTLNEGQTEALMLVAETFKSPHAKPICLIKGVFGAGKSYLLAVTVQFIASVLNLLDGKTEGVSENYTQSKILIASMTNVAVDRILLALTEQGLTDFVRVGSLKKIAKPILPHSLHASGNVNTGLKELEGMLKDEEISQSEKLYVKKCISQQKIGLQKQKLGETRVVGVTCAACSFSILDNLTFKVVLLDECSQMMEPLTLLPIKRAACTRLVLVGDPRQLKPTIQLSESVHQRGLEQTMFDRLEAMGMPTCQLTKQYRCHPEISSICRNLFYDGILEDGVTASQRPPLCNGLPAVCVFNIKGSQVYSHNSVSNEKEAKFVAQLISWLLAKGGVDPVQIGIVTLYKAQVQVIVSYLAQDPRSKGVSVATVDSFQGGERDVIILSAVRTDQMGFVDDIRRTNVALSRGKNHLFIVGHVANLRRNPLWKNVVLNIEGFGDRIIEGESQIKKWNKQQIEAKNFSFSKSSHETSLNTVNGVTPSSKLNGVDADLNSPSLSFSSLTEEITDSPFPF